MSKPLVINPWMLDQVDRLVSYAVARGLPLPSRKEWGFLEGFRRADQDVDRLPGTWMDDWHPLSRSMLEKTKALRRERKVGVAVPIARISEDEQVCVYRFERDIGGGLDKKLASSLIDARAVNKQAWIKIGGDSHPSQAALDASLRLGSAWWCEPPESKAGWEGFCLSQCQWSEVILRNPSWDQWVWPWSCMIEQGLRICLEGKKPSASRFGSPEGWKDRKAAAWGGLGMKAWQSAVDTSEGMWEDLWIGLLCDRTLNNESPCE